VLQWDQGIQLLPNQINKVLERQQNQGNYDSNDDISQQLAKWSIKDDENILRGPKIRIAACETVGGKTLHAIAYRDIFDKKKGQKKIVSLLQDSPAWRMLFAIGQQLQNLPPSQSLENYLDHLIQKTTNTWRCSSGQETRLAM
jgi:hypothetical protein